MMRTMSPSRSFDHDSSSIGAFAIATFDMKSTRRRPLLLHYKFSKSINGRSKERERERASKPDHDNQSSNSQKYNQSYRQQRWCNGVAMMVTLTLKMRSVKVLKRGADVPVLLLLFGINWRLSDCVKIDSRSCDRVNAKVAPNVDDK